MSPDELSERDPRRWHMLAVLVVTLVLSMSTWFSATAVVPQLREAWRLSGGAAAWLTIAVQAGFVVGAIISSLLNLPDRIAPRHVMLGGSVGAALANALLEASGGGVAGIALRMVTGVFLAGTFPPAFKQIATWFKQDRGTALGVLVGAVVIGQALPHLINGLGALDWRVVIYSTSALSLLGGLLAELAVRDGPFPFPRARFDPGQMWRALENRGVRLACFGYFGHMWELFAVYAWLLAFISAVLEARGSGGGPSAAFITFGVVAAGAPGAWAAGRIGDRWGKARAAALMLATSAACSLLIGGLFSAPMALLMAVAIVWGLSVVADSAQFSALVTELADQAYVGTALTVQTAIGFLLTVPTIWLMPRLVEVVGWRWAFAALAPGPIFGLASMLRLDSMLRPRRQERTLPAAE